MKKKNLYIFRICYHKLSQDPIGQSPTDATVTFQKVRHKSNLAPTEIWVYIWSNIHVYTRDSNWNPDWLQHDHPTATAYVIAQQYSSSTFVSLCFYSHKEKLGACIKGVIVSFFTFFKLRNLKFCMPVSISKKC